jgi:WD40 repeat protein
MEADLSRTQIFISYGHQDGTGLAKRLLHDLAREGWNVWLDSTRLNGGTSWTVEIELALDCSDIILALLSRSSFVSDVCRAEQLRSLRKHKCVIPVLVQVDADRPIHLESKQFLDFSTDSNYSSRFPELLDCIRRRSGATVQARFSQTYVTVPPLPSNYIERTSELRALRATVLRDGAPRRVALTALKGMAGIGKTVLAQALGYDEVTQAAFPDGIIWVPVGKDPRDFVPLLREVGKAIGDSLEGYDSLQSASNRLRNCLRDKAALLILDDVWNARDAAPFLFDSPRSRLMITTRDARTAISLGALQQELTVLTWEQALQLIALWADCDLKKLPPEASEIVRECACLPLAVAMVGAQIRGNPDRWRHVLQKLRNADLDRIRQSFPAYPHPDLLRAIDVSMEALGEELRHRYLDFAVFPEDCAIPESAVGTLWNLDEYEVADSVDQLVDLSLATRDSDRRLRIHDLVLDYLRLRLGGDNLVAKHCEFLDSYARRCSGDWPQGRNDGYFFENLIWHLRSAHKSDEALRLLTDFRWMQTKLSACGITALLADYEWFSPRDETARLLQEALRLSAYVLSKDPAQLAGQLLGRLPDDSPAPINTLRVKAERGLHNLWLKPLRSLLTQPGGSLVFTLASHNARIRSLALTANATKAISASDDHTIKIWDLRRGTLDRTLTGHTDVVRALAILPGEERAVSASDDHTLRVWNLSSGIEEARIDTQIDWVRHLVTFAQFPNNIASISDDRSIKLWALDERRVVRVLRGHVAEINCAAAMPDGRSLITGADDRTLRIWTSDGQLAAILRDHTTRITSVAVSNNGSIVSIAADGVVRLWTSGPNWKSQVLNWKLPGARSASFTPDGSSIVAAVDDSNVHVWDLAKQQERTFEGHSDWVNCIAVSPDGSHVLSGSEDGTLKLWDLTRNSGTSATHDHADRVRSVAITPDGNTAISTSDDYTLRIWNMADRTVRAVIRNQHHWVFACAPDSRSLIRSGAAGSCFQWEIESGREVGRFAGHQDRVRSLAVTPCGTRMISGGDDRTIRVWDIQSGNQIRQIELVRQWPRSIAVTSEGGFAITAAESSTLKLWNLDTGAETRSFRGHRARVNAVVLASDQRLVSGSDDHTLRVWNLGSGELLHVLAGHDGKVNALASLPGGRLVASASDDCDVKLWDVIDGVLVATFTVESPVLTCAGSPMESVIIAGDRSGLVHFFAVEGDMSERATIL